MRRCSFRSSFELFFANKDSFKNLKKFIFVRLILTPRKDIISSWVRGLNITMVKILLFRQAAGDIGNYLMIRMSTIYCDLKVLISRTDSFINILKWTIIWSFQFKVINLMFLQWMPIEQGDSWPISLMYSWPNFKAARWHKYQSTNSDPNLCFI